MNKFTSETARRVLNENKDNTLWFTDGITLTDMYDMLRYRMKFGEAETLCIIASLKLNGAKIIQDKNKPCEIFKVKTEHQGVIIPDYTDTWSAFEKAKVGNKIYYIMENDYWGDETCLLVCTFEDDDVQVICETFDDIETALSDEEII